MSNVPQRKFVSGEKFWVIGMAVKDDAAVLRVYSDPYADVRYYSQIKFPFPKHSVPPPDDLLKTISEVLTVQPAENSAGDAAPQQAAPEPATAAPEPIAPPPPPPDAQQAPPKTLELGQTKDQLVANFGQPQKVVKLGAKEICYYPDMKVTLVNGKVTDVQ